MKYLVLMLMLGFGGLTGCSSDSDTSNETDAADQSDATDTSNPSDTSDATDTGNACANEGFTAVAALSTIQVSESYATLEGYSSETAPFDILAIEMYSGEYGGPEGPGSYEIDGSNYQDCGLCVLIYQGVEGQSANKTFYASTGGVEISEWDEATNTITATLTNAEFQEVTINDNTFVSTPVAGGETWCISSITLEGVDPDGSDASDTSDPSDASDASDASDPSDASDSTDSSDASDTSDATDPSEASDASDSNNDDGCTYSSFEGATQSFGNNGLIYQFDSIRAADDATNDVLTLEFYDGLPTAGSSFEFTGESFADCSTCLYLQLGGNTERAFLAISGVLTVDTVSETTITGSFSDVVLGQTTTPFGSSATFVEGGETFCFGNYGLSVQ